MVDQVYGVYNQWIGRIVDLNGNQGSGETQATYFAYDQGQIALDFAGSTSGTLVCFLAISVPPPWTGCWRRRHT